MECIEVQTDDKVASCNRFLCLLRFVLVNDQVSGVFLVEQEIKVGLCPVRKDDAHVLLATIFQIVIHAQTAAESISVGLHMSHNDNALGLFYQCCECGYVVWSDILHCNQFF